MYGARKKPNYFLRVIISLSVAVIISFALIFFGSRLGEKVPDEITPETTAPESTLARPEFDFKTVEEKFVSDRDSVHLFGENGPDAVVLNVSDKTGKLNCITSINSLLYGNAVNSELRPIEALLYEAKLKAKSVSVRFTPFVNEASQEYADLCSAAVIGALSGYEIDEIVLNLDNVTPELAARLKQSGKGVKVGGIISLSMLENEFLVKEFYKALDFLVLDLTGLDITSYKGESDTLSSETTDEAETVTGGEESPAVPEKSVESVLEEYSLTVIKYSVRLSVTCDNEAELADFLEFYRSFGLCGYEINASDKE